MLRSEISRAYRKFKSLKSKKEKCGTKPLKEPRKIQIRRVDETEWSNERTHGSQAFRDWSLLLSISQLKSPYYSAETL